MYFLVNTTLFRPIVSPIFSTDGGEMPAVTAAGHLGPGGCDESASMSLTYTSGATATLATHSKVQLPNEVREQTPPSHIIVKFWPLMGSVSNEAKIYACHLFSLTF